MAREQKEGPIALRAQAASAASVAAQLAKRERSPALSAVVMALDALRLEVRAAALDIAQDLKDGLA